MRYHFSFTDMAMISMTDSKCRCRFGAMGTLLHCQYDCKVGEPLWKTVWQYL